MQSSVFLMDACCAVHVYSACPSVCVYLDVYLDARTCQSVTVDLMRLPVSCELESLSFSCLLYFDFGLMYILGCLCVSL